MRLLFFLFIGLIPLQSGFAQSVPRASVSPSFRAPGETNSDVLAFCRRRLGTRVSNGQCAALAAAALRAARAVPRERFAGGALPGDYVWGRLIYEVEVRGAQVSETGAGRDVRPGDIIQFRDTVFANTTALISYRIECLHHTAVVDHIDPDGMTCYVLEQNNNDRLYVTEGKFYLPHLRQGGLKVYRAVPERSASAVSR